MILQVLPAATLLIAALVAVLPFGAGEAARACLSFVPVIVVHYWSARRPRFLPATIVFAVGIAIDVLSHGPVGFWALMMLASAALARLEETITGHSTAAGRAAVFSIAMLAVAGLAWSVASAYNGTMIDGQPLLFAALISIGAYPVFAMLLMPLDRLGETTRSHLFARGG